MQCRKRQGGVTKKNEAVSEKNEARSRRGRKGVRVRRPLCKRSYEFLGCYTTPSSRWWSTAPRGHCMLMGSLPSDTGRGNGSLAGAVFGISTKISRTTRSQQTDIPCAQCRIARVRTDSTPHWAQTPLRVPQSAKCDKHGTLTCTNIMYAAAPWGYIYALITSSSRFLTVTQLVRIPLCASFGYAAANGQTWSHLASGIHISAATIDRPTTSTPRIFHLAGCANCALLAT